MLSKRRKAFRNRLIFSIILVVTGLAAISILAVNVTRELRLLDSARSDNVQWTLSQIEVEFLEYERDLLDASRQKAPDLTKVRREFDIFFSRVNTLSQSPVYRALRQLPEFSENLDLLLVFLNQSAESIDGPDSALIRDLPQLVQAAGSIRPSVRRVSNAGLGYFATEADLLRENISKTLVRLAVGVTFLVATLILLALYLGRLNRLNIRRTREARQASKRMDVVTGTALDAVIVADIDGCILDFNAAAEQTFGYAAADVIGQNLDAFIIPDHQLEAHAERMVLLRDKGARQVVGKGRVKMEAKRANGDVFPVELAIQSAETDEGEIFVSFLRDISHRVAAEQSLMQARDRALAGEKAKTDFLATMSHEIRTPLNGLLGNLTLLQDTQMNERQQQYVRNMNTSGKLLMSHISDVLDITKYDAGKLKLRPVVMNISTLVQDIVDNQSGAATAKDTVMSWRWEGTAVDWILADNERIQHVLMNIVGNAVKFTPEGAIEIVVRAIGLPNSPTLRFEVKDTGIGIPLDLQDEIFGDFMTGDASYDRDVEGTGLGLGIAQRFVTAMGGTIKVDSTPGKGSTFTIEFPVVPSDAPQSAEMDTQPKGPIDPMNILLVEDNEINRLVAREMLRAQGHAVVEAANGEVGVSLAEGESFDLILMDISMPVMDGRTATRAIRSGTGASSQAPIVALTANAVAEEQEAFLTDGMNDVLTKPLSRDGLATLLARYASVSPAQKANTLPANQHLQELRETLGPELSGQMIARFVAEVEEALAFFAKPALTPSAEAAAVAHRLAGSAGMMGATPLRDALIAVENAAKTDAQDAFTEASAELPTLWASQRAQFVSG